MSWILLATSAAILMSVLAAPLPELDAKNSSDIDPLLVPKTSEKFAEVFKNALEICGAFTPHQVDELKDAILMLTDALGDFPEVQDMERILLEATAATIAREVVENAAKDGGIFAKISCVDQALKTSFELTTGKPDHAFISEVEKMIEDLFLQDYQPGESSFSYEGSYSSFYDEDYSDYSLEDGDSFDDENIDDDNFDYDNYEDDSFDYDNYEDDSFDYDNYDDGDDYDDDSEESDSDYFDEEIYEEYFESPEYYEDYSSIGYLEYSSDEMEYLESLEQNLEYGFRREDYDSYENTRDRVFREEPVFFELVPVEYGVIEVPVTFY